MTQSTCRNSRKVNSLSTLVSKSGMRKLRTLMLFFPLSFASQFADAALMLSGSGNSVINTVTGDYWYRDIGATYFGTSFTYSQMPGGLVYILNQASYDGKNNWSFASLAQIQDLVTQIQIPATPTGPYDSGNPFTPAAYTSGGGHYNWDWSIGPEWEGLLATPGGPGEHMIFTLGFYKVDQQPNSYEYRQSISYACDGCSGPSGAWLVATAETPPSPIPEPTTLLLVGASLAGLAGLRKFIS